MNVFIIRDIGIRFDVNKSNWLLMCKLKDAKENYEVLIERGKLIM